MRRTERAVDPSYLDATNEAPPRHFAKDYDAVVDAIEALPPRQRAVVELTYWGRKSLRETAAELGITHSAVVDRRNRAMKNLRRKLGGLIE